MKEVTELPFESDNISGAIFEIRDLLRLLAEPAIAERDQKRRGDIRRIIGSSAPKAKAVLLMDGTRNQTSIHQDSGLNRGHLSTLVKQLSEAELLVGDVKQPKLAIMLPQNFFESVI
jgi:hypothetical protein